jgi:hypothetical protein
MIASTAAPNIGEPVARIDGWAKASGAHIHPSDSVIEGMLSLRSCGAAAQMVARQSWQSYSYLADDAGPDRHNSRFFVES